MCSPAHSRGDELLEWKSESKNFKTSFKMKCFKRDLQRSFVIPISIQTAISSRVSSERDCTYVYSSPHGCMCACMYVCTRMFDVYSCMYVCMIACMHVCMYANIHANMHLWMFACVFVWMFACIFACVHVAHTTVHTPKMYTCMHLILQNGKDFAHAHTPSISMHAAYPVHTFAHI